MKLLKDSQLENPLLHPHEVDLITLCISKPAILSSSWQLPALGSDTQKIGGKEMIDKFERDLEVFGYHLPPGYDSFVNWYTGVIYFSI